jgi:hypothetical protein
MAQVAPEGGNRPVLSDEFKTEMMQIKQIIGGASVFLALFLTLIVWLNSGASAVVNNSTTEGSSTTVNGGSCPAGGLTVSGSRRMLGDVAFGEGFPAARALEGHEMEETEPPPDNTLMFDKGDGSDPEPVGSAPAAFPLYTGGEAIDLMLTMTEVEGMIIKGSTEDGPFTCEATILTYTKTASEITCAGTGYAIVTPYCQHSWFDDYGGEEEGEGEDHEGHDHDRRLDGHEGEGEHDEEMEDDYEYMFNFTYCPPVARKHPVTGFTKEVVFDIEEAKMKGGGMGSPTKLQELSVELKFKATMEMEEMPPCVTPEFLDYSESCNTTFSCAGLTVEEFFGFALDPCMDFGTKNHTEIYIIFLSTDCNQDGMLTKFEFELGPCFCFMNNDYEYEDGFYGMCPLFYWYNMTGGRQLRSPAVNRRLQEMDGTGMEMPGAGSGSGSGGPPPPCVMAPGVCCPNYKVFDYMKDTLRFESYTATPEGETFVYGQMEFEDKDSNGCLDVSEQLQLFIFLVPDSATEFDQGFEHTGVAAGVRQVSNSMPTSSAAATKSPKLTYALEGMTERTTHMVGQYDANQDGVVTQREATNSQYDQCEVDFLEADQAGGTIDKMLSVREAAHMFKKLHGLELGSAFTMVYIRDGCDGTMKDDMLTMSELCKPLEQIITTGTMGSGSGSGSGFRVQRALRPMLSLIEDQRDMKKERRALMVAKQNNKHQDGDERRLEVLNEAMSDKHHKRFSYAVLKAAAKHAKTQRRLESSRRLEERFPDLVVPERLLQGSGSGSGSGEWKDMGCEDMPSEDISSLDPPAPASTCPEIFADPRLIGVSCFDPLTALGAGYEGATLCAICCKSCADLKGDMCAPPPKEDDYYDMYADEAEDYVAQFLAQELHDLGILAGMTLDEFLQVFMLLAMDCAPTDLECEAVSEFMAILGYAAKDPEVSDEFAMMNISTTDSPSPFVTCRKELVEEVSTDGMRLRAVRKLGSARLGRRAQDSRYCHFTGPDEEPCCALNSFEDQDSCLMGKGLPLTKAPPSFEGGMMDDMDGMGSGSGSGMMPPDLLMSPADAIAMCEVLTGADTVECTQKKQDVDAAILAQAGMMECPDFYNVFLYNGPGIYFGEEHFPYYFMDYTSTWTTTYPTFVSDFSEEITENYNDRKLSDHSDHDHEEEYDYFYYFEVSYSDAEDFYDYGSYSFMWAHDLPAFCQEDYKEWYLDMYKWDYSGYSYGSSYSSYRRLSQEKPKKRRKLSSATRPGLRNRAFEVIEAKPRTLFRLEQTARRLNGGSDHEKDIFRERQRRLQENDAAMEVFAGDNSLPLTADDAVGLIDTMSMYDAMGTCPELYFNNTPGWATCNMFNDFAEDMMMMVDMGANPSIMVTSSGYTNAANGRIQYNPPTGEKINITSVMQSIMLDPRTPGCKELPPGEKNLEIPENMMSEMMGPGCMEACHDDDHHRRLKRPGRSLAEEETCRRLAGAGEEMPDACEEPVSCFCMRMKEQCLETIFDRISAMETPSPGSSDGPGSRVRKLKTRRLAIYRNRLARQRTRKLLHHDAQRIRRLQLAPFAKGEPAGKLTSELKHHRRAKRFSKDMRLAKARKLQRSREARRLAGHESAPKPGCECTGVGYPNTYDFAAAAKSPEYGTYCAAWDDGVCHPTSQADGSDSNHTCGPKAGETGPYGTAGCSDIFPGIEGTWCCQPWCFVSCECEDANTVGGGLFYSYGACSGTPTAYTDDTCPWDMETSFESAFLAAGLEAMVMALESQREVPGVNDACPRCVPIEEMYKEAAMACEVSNSTHLRKLLKSPGRKLSQDEQNEVHMVRTRAHARARKLLSTEEDPSELCGDGTAVFVELSKPCVTEEAYETLYAFLTVADSPPDLMDMLDLQQDGLFKGELERAEVATQDPAASMTKRSQMGEALPPSETITIEIASEYLEECNQEGSTNDADICAEAEKIVTQMKEGCVAGAPAFDKRDMQAVVLGKFSSIFVADDNGLISKGNFICAKVLLEGVDPELAASEYEEIAEDKAKGCTESEVNTPNFPELLKQVGGGGCPTPTEKAAVAAKKMDGQADTRSFEQLAAAILKCKDAINVLKEDLLDGMSPQEKELMKANIEQVVDAMLPYSLDDTVGAQMRRLSEKNGGWASPEMRTMRGRKLKEAMADAIELRPLRGDQTTPLAKRRLKDIAGQKRRLRRRQLMGDDATRSLTDPTADAAATLTSVASGGVFFGETDMNNFMIAIELYLLSTKVEEDDDEGLEKLEVMHVAVLKIDAWINGKCFGDYDRGVVVEAIAIIFGLAAPKGDIGTMVCKKDLMAAVEQGLLNIDEEEVTDAWTEMTEKLGSNNDGSMCVDSSKLLKEGELLAPEDGAESPEVDSAAGASLTTRRLRAVNKARRLTERAETRLRRKLTEERRLAELEKYKADSAHARELRQKAHAKSTSSFGLSDVFALNFDSDVHHPTGSAPRELQAIVKSYYNVDLGADEYRDADEITCALTTAQYRTNYLNTLAAACPRECIFFDNETALESEAAVFTCEDEDGVEGPCPLCEVGPMEEFGESCSVDNTCKNQMTTYLADETALKCFLKYSFHEIPMLYELKSKFTRIQTACDPALKYSEFDAAPFSATDMTATVMTVPSSFEQIGSAPKIFKVRGECSIDNVMENEADARLFFEGAMPWSVTASDLIASMITITEKADVMLQESSAMFKARMVEEIETGAFPEAEGALLGDMLNSVFESKRGSCGEGHECTAEDSMPTSVPVRALIFAFVNKIAGAGGVVVNHIKPSLDTGAFGSSECLVMCSEYDVDGSYGTCEPLDYEKLGNEMKAFQSKQNQLSSFLYFLGKDMVYEQLCMADSVHRVLRGRALKSHGRKLGDDHDMIPCNETMPCDGSAECLFGECVDCGDILSAFEEEANKASTLVVVDGIEAGFGELQKFVDGMYGDCLAAGEEMSECSHLKVIGTTIVHTFEHSIEMLKKDPELLVHKLMEAMADDAAVFSQMQERILELVYPMWSDSADDPDDVLSGSNILVALDMCDPMMSFGRKTDIAWHTDCVKFESLMCLAVDSSNATMLQTEEGMMSMYFCARAYMAFYPKDDGIFKTCLKNAAGSADGPTHCIAEELDDMIVDYIEEGLEGIKDENITSPTGADNNHLLSDAMLAYTMDPVNTFEANVEMYTYTRMRRLHEKRRLQAEEDCVTLNGKKYCTQDTSLQTDLEPKVPYSNGKITRAHQFFARKRKARKLMSSHKSLIRKHRQLSRR